MTIREVREWELSAEEQKHLDKGYSPTDIREGLPEIREMMRHGRNGPSILEIAAESGSRVAGFLAGLKEAAENPDYQPTSRIGRLLKAIMERREEGASEIGNVIIEENPRPQTHSPTSIEITKPSQAEQPQSEPEVKAPAGATPQPVPASPYNMAEAAVAALANGSTNREDIRAIEQATIENLNIMRAASKEPSQIDRALGVMEADGNISRNEYKVFQAIIEKSGVDLASVGISHVKDIDTTAELGQALSAMQKQRETSAGITG